LVTFIAEASSNHGQEFSRALQFVDATARRGCDAVKVQLVRVEELLAPEILAKSEKHCARVKWELPS
jgi:N-acetylneuraminate synthase